MDAEIAIAAVSAFGSIVSAPAMVVAAVGIWVGIRSMNRVNTAHAAQAAEDAAQAAEDRKVTQALMAALERRGAALETLIRRTVPPQSGSEE